MKIVFQTRTAERTEAVAHAYAHSAYPLSSPNFDTGHMRDARGEAERFLKMYDVARTYDELIRMERAEAIMTENMRCRTNKVGTNGECLHCGAIQDEACRIPGTPTGPKPETAQTASEAREASLQTLPDARDRRRDTTE